MSELGESNLTALRDGAAGPDTGAAVRSRWTPRLALSAIWLALRRWALPLAAVGLAVAYVVVGARAAGSTDNDPAYYFGVARHIARTHRYHEPIVWHFLTRPAHVLHRPFDYWPGLPALALLPFFALFGATHHVAGATMGLVSGLSIVAFAYLVAVAAPLRSAIVQLTALLLYVFSPALMRFRFDVETIPFVHLFLLIALLALARRRSATAVAASFLMFLSRPEDIVLALLLSAFALAVAAGDADPRRRVARTFLTGFLCATAYVVWSAATLGAPTPPGAAIAVRVTDYGSIYRWLPGRPEVRKLRDYLTSAYLCEQTRVGLTALQQLQFFPNYPIWLALAMVRGCRWPRGRPNVEGATWTLLFGGTAVIALINPTMFAWQRSLQALLPVFVLAGAYGADDLVARVSKLASRAKARWPLRVAGPAVALVLAAVMLCPLPMALAPGEPLSFSADMAALNPTLAGGTTMSTRPWSVIAETDSPAVFLPLNGEQAIEEVIARYGVRWVLLVGDECSDVSQAICRELASGARHQIGRFTLTKTTSRGELTLFDVR